MPQLRNSALCGGRNIGHQYLRHLFDMYLRLIIMLIQKLFQTIVIAIGSTIKHYPLCHPMQFGFNVYYQNAVVLLQKFTILHFLIIKLLFFYGFLMLVSRF